MKIAPILLTLITRKIQVIELIFYIDIQLHMWIRKLLKGADKSKFNGNHVTSITIKTFWSENGKFSGIFCWQDWVQGYGCYQFNNELFLQTELGVHFFSEIQATHKNCLTEILHQINFLKPDTVVPCCRTVTIQEKEIEASISLHRYGQRPYLYSWRYELDTTFERPTCKFSR